MKKAILQNRIKSCIITGFLFLSIYNITYSQITARALGMGGAYTALARGVHAADWNPANLGFPDNPKFSMSFVSVGIQISNNSFTQDMYNEYVGKELSSADVSDILSSIPESGLRFGVRGTVRMLSFSAGKFAMTLGSDFGTYCNLEKDIFELVFKGNELDKAYRFNHIDASGEGLGLIGFSYGDQIPVEFAEMFTVGGTLNLIYGLGYAKVEKADFTFITRDYGFNLNGEYETKTALGNMGWGLTVGAAAKKNEKLTLSMSFTNLLSNLSWSKDVERARGYIHADSVAVLDFDEDDEDDQIADSSWSEDGKRFSTRLPVQIRLGALYEEGDFVMTADYTQGFRRTAWTNTTPQLAVGTEWRKVKWLPLRMGVLLGGQLGFGTSFGFGIRPGGFLWDVAIMNRGFITSGSSKGLVIATELGLDL
ncbi:hypothetical protein JW835_00070 [bacterium]|nr:hypothetical protein [bacterium]